MDLQSDIIVNIDPAAFFRAFGLAPDPWQAELLRGGRRNTLLLCCRQAGKSTVTAALALHEALYRPGSLVLMLAPALRQSQEVYRKLVGFYQSLGAASPGDARSALRLELANGSRIISLPGREQTIRGFSGVRLLVVDEAARVPDELYYAVRPMLAVSNGTVIALSTPYGQRGWFHREWTSDHGAPTSRAPSPVVTQPAASSVTPLRFGEGPGEGSRPPTNLQYSIFNHQSGYLREAEVISGDWQRIRVPASDCPRIAPAFLDQERRSLGSWWFSQEYECEFNDTDDQVFATEHINAALDPNIEPLDLGAF